VEPEAQAVAPVYPIPPHRPYFCTVSTPDTPVSDGRVTVCRVVGVVDLDLQLSLVDDETGVMEVVGV
jgi:hypothetical protein